MHLGVRYKQMKQKLSWGLLPHELDFTMLKWAMQRTKEGKVSRILPRSESYKFQYQAMRAHAVVA